MNIPAYWWPYLYQYGVGLVIFLIGIGLILGYKSCNLSRQKDRFWFGVLMFGFIWYAGIHFTWYQAAIHIMPEAGATMRLSDELRNELIEKQRAAAEAYAQGVARGDAGDEGVEADNAAGEAE